MHPPSVDRCRRSFRAELAIFQAAVSAFFIHTFFAMIHFDIVEQEVHPPQPWVVGKFGGQHVATAEAEHGRTKSIRCPDKMMKVAGPPGWSGNEADGDEGCQDAAETEQQPQENDPDGWSYTKGGWAEHSGVGKMQNEVGIVMKNHKK